MITVHIEVPYASFRKSYARSFADSYALPPPATVYGMLLSLVGEWHRSSHEGVKLAMAFKSIPRIATTLRKLSRLKYGVSSKQAEAGNKPEFVETLCGIDFVCYVDSSGEVNSGHNRTSLEQRILSAINTPDSVNRSGILCLGLSDDAVDNVALVDRPDGNWLRLLPHDRGTIELPVWVDHVGGVDTRWQRYHLDDRPQPLDESGPGGTDWQWTQIQCPGSRLP